MATETPANPTKPVWDPSGVAGYMVVSLTKAANECAWPDDLRGNAARLLIQDLGEFGQAMVACGRANFWSPAKALERMFIERVEVLMGASVDAKVAQRYLFKGKEWVEAEEPLKPATRARPEDAFDTYVRVVGMTGDDREEFRRAWLAVKNISSDWFVHPTALGPLLSKRVHENTDEAAENWALLIQLLAYGCIWAITVANPLTVTVPVELLRSLDAAAKCLDQLDSPNSLGIRDLHSFFAERATIKQPDVGAG